MTQVSQPASAQAFSESLPSAYRSRFGPAEIAAHAHIFVRRQSGRVSAGLFPWGEEGVSALCVVVEDRPGLLSLISQALSECGFDVREAEAFCREGKPQVAVDFFWLRDKEEEITAEDVQAFSDLLGEVLEGKRTQHKVPMGSLPRAARDTTVRFGEENDGSLAVLEVETADRSGLLWAITRALHQSEVQILGSKISTRGERVKDRFAIAELDGSPISGERRLLIQVAVLTALETPPH